MPRQVPAEILLHILSYLIPDGNDIPDHHYARIQVQTLSRMSRASRELRRIAEPILYGQLPLGYHTLKVLETLCSRPDLGEHVRSISYSSWDYNAENCATLERLLYERISPLIRDKYRWPALNQFLKHLLDGGIDLHWEDNGGVLPQTLLLTLILCLTPNIEILNVNVDALDDKADALSRLFELCGRYVCGVMRRARKDGDSTRSSPVAPLHKLRSLQLTSTTSHGEPDSCRKKNVYPLFLFPRLETLELCSFNWVDTSQLGLDEDGEEDEDEQESDGEDEDEQESDGEDEEDADDDRWPSRLVLTSAGSHPNLKSFALLSCLPSSFAGLREMLRIFPNLHTLICHYVFTECREAINLTMYGSVLREFGPHLRHFELEPAEGADDIVEKADGGALGSLRARLTSLEQLRCPISALVGSDVASDEDNGADLDLCSFLPPSLRWFWTSVTAIGDASVHYKALAWMLDEAGSAAERNGQGRLPALEWVMVGIHRDSKVPTFEPCGFDVLRVSKRHFLYRKRSAAPVRNPPGWRLF
ncbi:uncharacterized protein B0I36DRAFT_387352 [Microdochium trichocladiopsis]|uniref:Uncharacterized protein n=1 Tax=Microdochium trichocladiopsis TaxID=1682393 RepID=A0A9P8XX98_9PEZI|nr:uncharacterized protein B0I36DRAFT_387352 [Microdochium trichocladiopsis]KAH7024944.1 hypothetical protein B0I36DRAFT_387352 [Microdochium trichocladiopsis]